VQPGNEHTVFDSKVLIMRKAVLVLALFGLFFYSWAQESEVRSVGRFNGVRAGEAIDVYLKKGDKELVKVEASGTTVSNVITEISGSFLKIHMKDGRYRNRNVKVYVTYVTLEKISASSAANIFSEGIIKATSLGISASSAGSVEISIEADNVRVDVSSAGDIVLEGKARRLEADASSAGEIDAYNLECEEVSAEASSAGSIKLNVAKQINAQASSGGSIRYRGSPARTNTNASSGGSVKRVN
jgi:hypothetical protein